MAFHTSRFCRFSFNYDIALSMFALLKIGVTVFFVISPASAPTYVVLVLSIAGGAIALGAGSWYLLERPLQHRLRLSSKPHTLGLRPIPVAELASEPS